MQVPAHGDPLEQYGSASFSYDTPAPTELNIGGIQVDVSDIPEEFRSRVQVAQGDVPQHVDFFDVLEETKFLFPDHVQYVTLKAMNEGDRKRYLNKTNRDVSMNTRTKELRMQAAAGDDKHALLELCITGWSVFSKGRAVPFNSSNLKNALENWPVSLVDQIEKKVREVNPWLLGDEDSLEALREERDELDKRIDLIEKRAAKN